MEKQAFIVTGLGYGDEGKGATTHWLACRHKAHTVIRTGGPQALHHVVTAAGGEHTFSQFGSGTLHGSKTHLSKHMLIEPVGMLAEGEALKYESGIGNVFDLATIHEDALVITPFQVAAGRLRELLRAGNRRGSVGLGVGETVLDGEALGADAVRARDLASPGLAKKLETIRAEKWADFESLADRARDLPKETASRICEELALLESPDLIPWIVERFGELAKRVRIVADDYVAKEVLGGEGAVVFEGSQGVLLDRWHGFHPYTTKVRTIPAPARDILRECAYDGAVASLGVLRAYHTRHGGGPFVTELSAYTEELPDEVNKEHPWQGRFRVGPLDAVAARYALAACGAGEIDGIVLTCLDRILPRGRFEVCTAYDYPALNHGHKDLIKTNGGAISEIAPHTTESPVCLVRQERVGRVLSGSVPLLTSFDIGGYTQESFAAFCKTTLGAMLPVPVVAVSVGRSEKQKFVL